jgi:hypothetical protein
VTEELQQGVDRAPGEDPELEQRAAGRAVLASTLLAVGAAVVVFLGAWQVVTLMNRPPPPPPRPSVSPAAAVAALQVTQSCAGFDQGTVVVAFRLLNGSQRTLRLLSVAPVLQMRMLTPGSVQLNQSACLHPVSGAQPTTAKSNPQEVELGPGQQLPVTFTLVPLEHCIQTEPVEALITVEVAGIVVEDQVAVEPDLGAVVIPGC